MSTPSPAIDKALPTHIGTKWVKTYRTRPFEDSDEVYYVATWADGRTTEHFTLPREWQAVFVASIEREKAEALARLPLIDAALDEAAKPLDQNTVPGKMEEAA